MSIYKVLDELEKAMRVSVNNSYSELVKEINYGSSKLLQTALSNAETFDNSIKTAIMELREQVPSLLADKDAKSKRQRETSWDLNSQSMNDTKKLDFNDTDSGNFISRADVSSFSDNNQNIIQEPKRQDYNDLDSRNFDSRYPPPSLEIKEENMDVYRENNAGETRFYNPINKNNVTNNSNSTSYLSRGGNGIKNPKSLYNLNKGQIEDKVGSAGDELILVHEEKLSNGLTIKSFTCKECAKKYTTKFDAKRHIARTH